MQVWKKAERYVSDAPGRRGPFNLQQTKWSCLMEYRRWRFDVHRTNRASSSWITRIETLLCTTQCVVHTVWINISHRTLLGKKFVHSNGAIRRIPEISGRRTMSDYAIIIMVSKACQMMFLAKTLFTPHLIPGLQRFGRPEKIQKKRFFFCRWISPSTIDLKFPWWFEVLWEIFSQSKTV